MVLAILILVLAWCIGDVTAELHAAQYLVQVLQNVLNPSSASDPHVRGGRE